jgi:hypothetical protein
MKRTGDWEDCDRRFDEGEDEGLLEQERGERQGLA